MKPSPDPAQNARTEPKARCAEPSFKVVFFYEDFDAAVRCRKAFDSIARKFGRGRPVEASSWSFSMMGSEDFNAAILLDSSAADVIVVAAHGDRELPPRIATWLEICVSGRGKPAPLLFALHAEGLEADGEAAPLFASLECIASRQGARAMSVDDLQQQAEHSLPIAMLPRRTAGAGGMLDPGTYPTTGAHRWWGINE